MTAEAVGIADEFATPEQAERLRRWAWDNPVQWVRLTLGLTPWSKQAEILRSVRVNRRTAVRSCHSVGKSVIAAATTLWYLHAQCPSKVVTTSATFENLKNILWTTIHELVRDAPYDVLMGGSLLKMGLEIKEGWGAYALSPGNSDSFGGYHSPNGVLVVVDEASALTPEDETAINGLLTTDNSRLLYIGNPTRPEGPFHDAFRRGGWHCIHIAAHDCPNVREGRTVIPGLATQEWVDDQAGQWGVDSPQYRVRVMGEFPEIGEDALIPIAWVEDVAKLSVPPVDHDSLRMGVDVARYGSDRTVLLVRDRHAVRDVETRQGQDTMWTAGATIAKAKEWGVEDCEVYIDDIGVGGGVTDRLKEQDFFARPVNAAEKPDDPDTYANRRAEMYWRLRLALRPESDERFVIPEIFADVGKECSGIHYGYTSSGKLKIEAKEDIKKRTKGVSPDEADALALTFARAYQRFTVALI